MAARSVDCCNAGGLALAGCNPLPRPDYVDVQQPAPYRTEPDGGPGRQRRTIELDAQGFRVNKDGERIGMVDMPAKTEGDNSNAVAGYYISTTGRGGAGPRRLDQRRHVDAAAGQPAAAGSQMPQQAPITPAPGNVPPPPGYR